jgi:hypothetical protein
MRHARWKGGGHGKRFGNKAREWFARRVWAKLEELSGRNHLTASELETLVGRFIAESERYVTWQDADEFRGRGFANGAWTIDWPKLEREIGDLLREVRADAARGAIPTLDDWLRADLTDSLEYSVAGGSKRLSQETKNRLVGSARARRRSWPLLCVDCGRTFQRRPGARGKPIRCGSCLEFHQRQDGTNVP